MKNFLKRFFVLSVLSVMIAVILTSCSGGYDVDIAIGDGNIENDSVICSYSLPEVISDGYRVKGYVHVESDADLNGFFIFSISTDSKCSNTFHETVLLKVSGENIANKTGRVNFDLALPAFSDLLPKDAESGKLYFHFHREEADRRNPTTWNTSDYSYVKNGDKITIEK